MNTIMITGATGGLGSQVVQLLQAQQTDANIYVLVRDAQHALIPTWEAQGIKVRVGSYDDVASLQEAFSGISVLYFVSGNDIANRRQQHQQVVQAAKEAGVKHIIYTSTVRKDESPSDPLYPVTEAHIKTETWIKDSGMSYTLLRHNLYAEVVTMFLGDQPVQQQRIYLPAGNGKTAFVTRADFAAAAARILSEPSSHEQKIYELNGSELLTFEAIGTIIASVTGNPISYQSPDVDTFIRTMTEAGLPEAIVTMLAQFSQAIAAGAFDSQSDDLSRLLGRAPQSVTEWIKQAYSK